MRALIIQVYLLFLLAISINAQNYVQTIKGCIIDKESHNPIGLVTVGIIGDNFNKGTLTDESGNFKIENVPVGRISMHISHPGYESIRFQNLELTSGKQLIVNIELIENSVSLDEVVVKSNKDKPINTLSSVSARTFSIEESKRYAGAGNDVSRMAMNFAGVKSTNETVNEIVIRGNSPNGLLFRLDGIDIPNPNHFGDGAASGGILSMLNNNVLSNSDFLTGAFPAEYGNTISGAFDLRMRSGNNEKHEYLFQIGLQGCELGVEGPISKKNRSSYLINYRYSTIKLMTYFIDIGLGTAIPNYQDISFKLNFPTKGKGNFSLIGLAGKSSISVLDSKRDTLIDKPELLNEFNYETDEFNDNNSGMVGLTHSYIIGKSAYTKLILSASTISNNNRQDSLSTINRESTLRYASNFRRTKYTAKFFINKKFNNKNSLRTGISIEQQDFNLSDSIYERNLDLYRNIINLDGKGSITQSYIQYQHKSNSGLKLNVGINTVFQSSTNNFSLEPRAGIKWELKKGNTFSFGYGLHSFATPQEILNQRVYISGNYTKANSNLDFTKSHHFVLSYDKVFSNKIRFKSELYYQYIFNSVIEEEISSFSLLNRGSNTATDFNKLINNGVGYNYGIEITFEKFMDHGMYFLSTLSLYESKYKGSDDILRNTAFNSNFVFNLLGGKEIALKGKKKNKKSIKKLTIDGKINWAGGQRYSPIDLEASRISGFTIHNENKAYSERMPAFFKIDLRAGFKFVRKKSTQELSISITNLTNRKNPFYLKYNPEIDNIQVINQFGIMPDIQYRITF